MDWTSLSSKLDSLTHTYVHTYVCMNVINFLVHPTIQDLGDVFDHMPYLWKVDLYGNPCSSRAKYRDRVITMVRGLGECMEAVLISVA